MSVGDRLARGDKTAQFSAGHSRKDEPIELKNVAKEPVVVQDRRPVYDMTPALEVPMLPEKKYASFKPILDRILVMRVSVDKNMEVLEDGSLRDKRTGFVIPAKYRQHSCIGEVLAVGDFVVIGGVKIPMLDIVKPGDRVMFGEYNAEKLKMTDEEAKDLCTAVGVNRSPEEDMDVIRVQDVRGIYRPEKAQ